MVAVQSDDVAVLSARLHCIDACAVVSPTDPKLLLACASGPVTIVAGWGQWVVPGRVPGQTAPVCTLGWGDKRRPNEDALNATPSPHSHAPTGTYPTPVMSGKRIPEVPPGLGAPCARNMAFYGEQQAAASTWLTYQMWMGSTATQWLSRPPATALISTVPSGWGARRWHYTRQ